MKTGPSIPWWEKIKNKLLLSLGITFVTSLILFGGICISLIKTDAIQQVSKTNLELSHEIKETTEEFLSSIMTNLFSLANNLKGKDPLDPQHEETLDGYLKDMQHVYQLTLFDPSGRECLRVFKKNVASGNWLSKRYPTKITFQKNVSISSVYPSEQIVSMIDMAVPMRDSFDNEISGVIKAGVSLQGLWETLSNIKQKRNTAIYIINQNGKLITHSDLGLVSANIDFSHIKKVKEFILGANSNKLLSPSIYYNNKNIKVIGVLKPIEKINWAIVIEEPLSSALSSFYRLQKIIIFILAALVLLLGFGTYILVTSCTRSIDNLTCQAETLSEEESSKKIETTANDETAYLAQIYNHLQKRLNKKDEKLKRRYKEIEALNGEFKESYDELEHVSEKLDKSQQELNKEREFEKQLVETANVLIAVLNEEGTILLFNKKCEEITEYNKNEVIGKNWFQIITPPERRKECLNRFHKALQEKITTSFECPIITKKGTQRTISWHSTFISDENNKIICIHVGEDITEKKNLQLELENKNKALKVKNEELQNFVSIVSHDLKSPLYILQDFTSILLHDYKSEFGEDVIYYLERIKKNSENMEKLIVDILEFSKIGTLDDEYQNYPIKQIIQRAIDELQTKIKQNNVRLVISENFPTILCDPNRMLQVFMNLLTNSIKFLSTERQGVIEIGCSIKGTENEFFVKDNGIGIEKEYHEKIFSIFQRLKESKDIEGNGVGLAIVKKIIENHGGKIRVDSEKGNGATFYFTLPTAKKMKEKENISLSSIVI